MTLRPKVTAIGVRGGGVGCLGGELERITEGSLGIWQAGLERIPSLSGKARSTTCERTEEIEVRAFGVPREGR